MKVVAGALDVRGGRYKTKGLLEGFKSGGSGRTQNYYG